MKYRVSDVIGEYGITLDDGQAVYDLIHPELLSDHHIELDFSDVNVLASPFFNAAIGQLLKDIDRENLNRLLTFSNLVPAGERVLRRVIANSKQYYSDEGVRNAQEHALSERAMGY